MPIFPADRRAVLRFGAPAAAFLFLLTAAPLTRAQVASTWSGGTGSWLTPGGWLPSVVPNGILSDVVIDGNAATASDVTLGRADNVGTDVTIGRLRIDTGDRLQFASGVTNLQIGSSAAFSGAGTIALNGTLALPFGSNTLRGEKTIAGSGTLTLGGTGQRPEIYDATTNSATIRGSALIGRANASNPRVVNSGLIEANIAGQDIDFHGQGGANRSVNTGTLRASGGGKMQLGQGEWLNTGGSLVADGADSQISFYRGGLLENGTISAVNDGKLQVGGSFNGSNGGYAFRNVTQQGSLTVLDGMLLQGTYTNNGIISVPAGRIDALVAGSYDPAQTVTIAGSGQIVIDKALGDSAFGYRRSIWLVQDQTIRGRGQIGDEDFEPPYITNRGTFQADRAGEVLKLRLAGLDNQSGGVLRARDGGVLRIATGGVLANTGGTIEATTGGRVEASFGRIEGGLVKNNGGVIDLNGLTLVNPGSGLRLEGGHTLGHPTAHQEARLVGDVENTGTLKIAGGTQAARLWLTESAHPAVKLSGGGEIVLGEAATPGRPGELWDGYDGGFSARTLTNVDNTIRGYGRIGNTVYDTWLALENKSVVQADVAGQTLSVGLLSATNAGGVFRAKDGGRLMVYARGGFNNTGGTVEALAGSSAGFSSTTITGGTISSASTGTLEFPDSITAQGGLTVSNAGTAVFGASGGTREFNGMSNGGSPFNNTGTLRKIGGGEYFLRAPLSSSGTIAVEGGVLRNAGGGNIVGSTQTAVAGSDMTFQNAVTFSFSGVNHFTGGGTHWFGDGVTIAMVNDATELRANNLNLNNVTISGRGLLSHTGTLRFYPQSSNTVSETRLSTAAGATASVETFYYAPVTFSNGARWENDGTIVFADAGWRPTLVGAAGTAIVNHSGGVIRAADSESATLDIATQNDGTIEVARGGLFLDKATIWTAGKGNMAADTALYVRNASMTVHGTANATTGEGWLHVVGSGSLSLPAGSRLAADRVGFWDTSAIDGPGELSVAKAAEWHPGSGAVHVLDGAQVHLLSGSANLLSASGATLRLQDGAVVRNAGTLDLRHSFFLEMNTGSILENAGIITVTSGGNNPGFGGDGTGLFRTLADSVTRFFPSNGDSYTVSFPLDLAGQLNADSGMHLTFDRGGLLNESAKVSPNHPNSSVTFTGSAPIRVRGDANEFPGTGYVNLANTTLQFEPSSIAGHSSSIAAGARVAFHGNNTVRGQGTLSSTGLVFQNGDQTVENATLQTVGGDVSVWNATGRKVEFKAGAQFRNSGRFVIQTQAGAPGSPAFVGEPGTRFHNAASGVLIQDSSTTTEFNIDFLNEGELEVRAGAFSFLKSFAGRGGIAATGGGKVTLPLGTAAIDRLPASLRTAGAGSEINIALPGGDKLIRIDVNGGRLVAAGAGNLVAAGGGNLVAAGGGNLVAAGGGNLVAAGAGHITAQGLNTLLQAYNLVGMDGGTLVGMDHATLITDAGMTLQSGASASLTNARLDAAGLVGMDHGTLVGNDGASLAAGSAGLINGSSASLTGAATKMEVAGLVGLDASTLVGQDGGTLVAAGGLNAINAAQLVGNDGGSLKAPGLAAGRASRSGDVTAGPGKIVARTGSVIAGNGTFEGGGHVLSGSVLRPGKQVVHGSNQIGTMQWNGSLEIGAGARLDVQIGGPIAGSGHDRLNVSQSLAVSGSVTVSFAGSYAANVTQGATFDIAEAAGGVTSAVAGTRVPVTNGYGSFLVSIVNGGTTLRLSDYQAAPATFASWIGRFGLTAADALPEADPFKTGASNLLKYALGIEPRDPIGSAVQVGQVTDQSGQRHLTLTYTRPTGANLPSELIYDPQRSSDLKAGEWVDGPSHIVPMGPAVAGPGELETVTIRSLHPIDAGGHTEFLRLRVVLP